MKENKLKELRGILEKHSKALYHSFAIGFWGILPFSFYEYLISQEWFSGVWSIVQEVWPEVVKDYNLITLDRVTKAIGVLIFTLTPFIKFLATLNDCVRQKIDPNAPLSSMLVFFVWAGSSQLAGGHIMRTIATIAIAYIMCEVMKWQKLQERAKALDCQYAELTPATLDKQLLSLEVKTKENE